MSLALAAALLCGAAPLSASAVLEQHRWQEYDATGRRLVLESGVMPAAQLDAAVGPVAGWHVGAAARLGNARRDYEGTTSRGAPLATHSDLQHSRLRLAVCRAPAGSALPETAADAPTTAAPEGAPGTWAWAAGAAIEWHQWQRDIASTATVAGFPERFSLPVVLGTLRLAPTRAGGPVGVLALEAGWSGGGRLHLQLPGRDAQRLPLGEGTLLRMRWQQPISVLPSRHWHWVVAAEQIRLRAGEPRPVRLQDVVVGSARQPRSSLQVIELGLVWQPAR